MYTLHAAARCVSNKTFCFEVIWCIFVKYREYYLTFKSSVNLTFDILTSKCGHESHVSWASLLPNFSFLCHAVLELGSDRQPDGRTDRQTVIIA